MLTTTRGTRVCSKRNFRGFTLLEVIISLTVLAVTLSMTAWLLKTFIQQVGKAKFSYNEKAMSFYWLDTTIGSMFYYTIQNRVDVVKQNKEFTYFFDGRPDSMTFITSSPLTMKSVAMDRIYLKDHVLYLNETPIFSKVNDYLHPTETGETRQISIFLDVQSVKFTYYRLVERNPYISDAMDSEPEEKADSDDVSPRKIKKVADLKDDVPALIKLDVLFKDGTESEWQFNVRSDYISKRGFTAEICHPITY